MSNFSSQCKVWRYWKPNSKIPMNKIGLAVGNVEEMVAYYTDSFRALQQLNCLEIAKAYIKFIEPKKQRHHPYSPEEEKTKPPWWPADVIHKEPNHLKRICRVKLLIHILRKSGITAEQLKQAGTETQRQCTPDKAAILDEIYHVREQEERYERDEIDGDALVYVREKTCRGNWPVRVKAHLPTAQLSHGSPIQKSKSQDRRRISPS
ncbi:hypothetical protein ACJ73_02108 [Blastomyces percursus]|uniref:Subtelomeric hrmA-associated cluster protein AFUB-079030/YDR124W-like helical bundle domain-containing protein n=1 Tax=Blastomyces percursus TaxID=1658174 RepID=A0A1J9QDA5_9EURO|nr:hypothetical protein ACJ73_02108 [Blastomyces percursus]